MDNKIYADAFNIIAGPSDIKLNIVSVDIEVDEEKKTISEKREVSQRVTFSLPVAKDLAKKLSEAVADYEKTFGTIVDLDKVGQEDK